MSRPDDRRAKRLIPITRPWMDEREIEAVRRPILSGWVTQGPEVAAFEREFADYVGAGHACAVSSCTTALHLALKAVGVQPGDEVITVSHSFIASANSIRYCGAKPIFVDIQPSTFNINPMQVEEAITGHTRAVLCVHQLGMPCDIEAICEIATRHGLAIVEDAACAIGSQVYWEGQWEKIGKPRGDIACFSFHPRKIISTGDGGMITTAKPEWDREFRLWRQHGMTVPDEKRHTAREVIFESYSDLGYNYRMTDIQAAIGREQLKRLPEIVARRREMAYRYHKLLSGIPDLVLPHEPEWARSNWQSYCVYLPPDHDQRAVMQAMLDAGVATRRGVMCAHREPAYANEPCSAHGGQNANWPLAESERAQDTAIILPLYPQMTGEEQSYVVSTLRDILTV